MITPPNSNFIKYSHCSFCGTRFTEQKNWPRKCFHCYNESYLNPLPVVVALLPVWENGRLGALIQRRNINPHKGEWALSGGFIDANEPWREAVAREMKEELGIVTKPELYNILNVTNDNNNHLIIFTHYTETLDRREIPFIPNEEVTEIQIVYTPVELCFSTHTDALKYYLNNF